MGFLVQHQILSTKEIYYPGEACSGFGEASKAAAVSSSRQEKQEIRIKRMCFCKSEFLRGKWGVCAWVNLDLVNPEW